VAELVVLAIILIAYFLPGIIAASRNHHQSGAIFVLNLLLGWTVLGWIGALVWASTAVHVATSPGVPSPAPTTKVEPATVENLITAKGGRLTYRVMAYRKMDKGELERAVWEALKSGGLKEPEAGGVATLVTDIR